MTTFKAMVLPHHLKSDGTYNVKIRVTHNGQRRYIATNTYVEKKHLTSKNLKIKSPEILDVLEERISSMRLEVSKLGMVAENMEIDELIDYLNNTLNKGEYFRLNFIKYGREKISKMKEGTGKIYTTTLNAILRFTNGKEIDIQEITSSWLKNFVEFLEEEPRIRTNVKNSNEKKGERAKSLYTSCIRHLYNMAREEYNDEERQVVPIPYNPFTRFKMPKAPAPKDRDLSVEVIQRIIDLDLDDKNSNNIGIRTGEYSRIRLARDMFLISFGLIGMNTADIYEMKKVRNGVVDYERKKTRDRRADRARMKVRVEPEIAKYMDKYHAPFSKDHQLTIPVHYSSAEGFSDAINKGLRVIADMIGVDRFTLYSARHSWSTIAHNVARIDKYLIHAAINHTDKSMSVTDIYIAKDYSLFWDANRKVLDLFKWK
jgi:integrase